MIFDRGPGFEAPYAHRSNQEFAGHIDNDLDRATYAGNIPANRSHSATHRSGSTPPMIVVGEAIETQPSFGRTKQKKTRVVRRGGDDKSWCYVSRGADQ